MNSHQARRRNIVLSTAIKRKVEEQQVEKLLALFLSLPGDAPDFWNVWYKTGRLIEQQRKKQRESEMRK